MSDYWISWYVDDEWMPKFELHSPWWVSGYDMDDRTIVVAAVRAESEEAAWAQVLAAFDDPPERFEQRFIDVLERDAFSDRFPQAEWMEWSPTSTCRCPTHAQVEP